MTATTEAAPKRTGRLSRTQRRRIAESLPPRRCTATSSSTGEACRSWAVVGTTVCHDHGGAAPQTRALADREVTLATALAQAGPGRSAQAILLDSMNTLDRIAQDVKLTATRSGGPVSPDLLAELVEATKTSATMAKIVADLKIDATALQRDQLDGMVFVLQVAAEAVGLKLSGRRAWQAAQAAFRELDALGPVVDDRAAAVERVVSRFRAELAANQDRAREEIAEHDAELRKAERAAHMINLKRSARQGACEVCLTPAGYQGAVPRVARAIGSGPESTADRELAVASTGLSDPLNGRFHNSDSSDMDPDTESDDPPMVLSGELLPADPRRCPGCRGDRFAPNHDQQCGWSAVERDRGQQPWGR